MQCTPFGRVIVLAKSEQQEYRGIHPLLSSGDSRKGWDIAKDPKLLVSSGSGHLWLGWDWHQMDVRFYIK